MESNVVEFREEVPAMPVESGSLYSMFLADCDTSQKTLETYTRNLKQFFVFLDSKGITQPTRADVLAYKEEIKSRLKPSTVQNYLAVVKIFFDWAERNRIYPNIAKKIKAGKVSRFHKKDNLTTRQVRSIVSKFDVETLKGKRDRAIFILMVSCGLRTIEIVRANVDDLRTFDDQCVLFVQGKGHEENDQPVNVPPFAEDAIRDYLTSRGTVSDGDPLFSSVCHRNKNGRMTTRSVSRIAKESMRASGINSSRYTAHSLRHTAITTAIKNKQSLDSVQGFARHESIDTTMIYNHANDNLKNQCSRIVSDALFGAYKKG